MNERTGEKVVVYGAVLAALLLVLTAPTPWSSIETLRSAGQAARTTDPLVALLALLAWLCAAYLLTVTALALGSSLPGLLGRACARLTGRLVPAALRRALEVTLGVTLAVGTLAGGTASAATLAPAPTPTVTAPLAPTTPASPSLDHPVTPTAAAATATPDLDWPGSPPPAPATAAPAPAVAAEQVVVRPGDSLWRLAQEQLARTSGGAVSDAAVAQAWPSWWQANREAIGDDPDVITPGTPLVPPTDS